MDFGEIMKTVGKYEQTSNIEGAAAKLSAAAARLTNLGVRTGALSANTPPITFRNPASPGQEFAILINKGMIILEELLKRLMVPNDPPFLRLKPTGPPAKECMEHIFAEVRRAYNNISTYMEESSKELPSSLQEANTTIELELVDIKDRYTKPIDYSEYNITETDDSAVNFLISMAEVLKYIQATPECMGASRIHKFSTNTTKPGDGTLGTLTFRDDVMFVLSYVVENRGFLDRARKYAELQLGDMIFDAVKLQNLENRLRALRGLRTLPESAKIAAMRAAKARLAGSGGGGAASGAGGNGPMGGGAYKNRKTRRGGRKGRKTLKGGRKTNKSRKNRKHH